MKCNYFMGKLETSLISETNKINSPLIKITNKKKKTQNK